MTNEEMAITLTRHDGQIDRHEGRIEALEARQDKLDGLVTSMATMSEKQATMERDVGEIKTDVKALAEKPAKRWDALVASVITAIVAFIIGYVLK